MFEKFISFVQDEKVKDINSTEEFLKEMSGRSFVNGLYRIFSVDTIRES